MDKRGLTVDPNRVSSKEKWYDTLGPTQKPSPYATASWVYKQSYEEVYEEVSIDDEGVIVDNGLFSDWLRAELQGSLDGGTLATINDPRVYADGSVYSGSGGREGFVKYFFARVRVYDSRASSPGPLGKQEVELGLLGIDSDELPVTVTVVVDPQTLVPIDNGDNFQNPDPNPDVIIDGGVGFNTGVIPDLVIDGAQWQIVNGQQEIITVEDRVFADGALLETDPGELEIEVTRHAIPLDDEPPGTLLGQINFEMVDCKVHITDWNHYNWMDDTPVRKAFKAMVNSLPYDVVEVTVDNDPHAFWTSLGFVERTKGDDYLYYVSPTRVAPY